MTAAHEALDASLAELDRLRLHLRRARSRQVNSGPERDVIKAVAYAWFRAHRAAVLPAIGAESLRAVDDAYRTLLSLTQHRTSRSRYRACLSGLRDAVGGLIAERAEVILPSDRGTVGSAAPSFASASADPEMQQLLVQRWTECASCVAQGLPLAATVLMGGLVEALLISRINRLSDKSAVFRARCAPKERGTGKALALSHWGLSNYIDVAHELGWISAAHRDVAGILRDYRNYIHPYKEYQQGRRITPADTRMLWGIAQAMIKELL